MKKGYKTAAVLLAGSSVFAACSESSPVQITSKFSRVANTPCETHDKDGNKIVLNSYPVGDVDVKYRAPGMGNEAALHAGEIVQLPDGNYQLFVPRLPEHFGHFKQDETAALALITPLLGDVSLTLGCVQSITNEFGAPQRVVNLPTSAIQ